MDRTALNLAQLDAAKKALSPALSELYPGKFEVTAEELFSLLCKGYELGYELGIKTANRVVPDLPASPTKKAYKRNAESITKHEVAAYLSTEPAEIFRVSYDNAKNLNVVTKIVIFCQASPIYVVKCSYGFELSPQLGFTCTRLNLPRYSGKGVELIMDAGTSFDLITLRNIMKLRFITRELNYSYIGECSDEYANKVCLATINSQRLCPLIDQITFVLQQLMAIEHTISDFNTLVNDIASIVPLDKWGQVIVDKFFDRLRTHFKHRHVDPMFYDPEYVYSL